MTEQTSYFAKSDPTGLRPECSDLETERHLIANLIADQEQRDAAIKSDLKADHMAALVEYVERAFASGERRVTVVVDFTAITVTHRVDRWVSGGREYRTIAGALGLNFPSAA